MRCAGDGDRMGVQVMDRQYLILETPIGEFHWPMKYYPEADTVDFLSRFHKIAWNVLLNRFWYGLVCVDHQ